MFIPTTTVLNQVMAGMRKAVVRRGIEVVLLWKRKKLMLKLLLLTRKVPLA